MSLELKEKKGYFEKVVLLPGGKRVVGIDESEVWLD